MLKVMCADKVARIVLQPEPADEAPPVWKQPRALSALSLIYTLKL